MGHDRDGNGNHCAGQVEDLVAGVQPGVDTSSAVSGVPSTSARPGRRQAERSSPRRTRMASVNSTEDNADLASPDKISSPGGTSPWSVLPVTMPTTRNNTAVESRL